MSTGAILAIAILATGILMMRFRKRCSLFDLVPGCAPSAGGAKNLARFLGRVHTLIAAQPYAQHFVGYPYPWEFSDAETAASRLRHAGFEEIETSLEEVPTKFPNAQEFQQFVESVVLRNHLDRIPDRALRDQLLAELTRQAASDNPAFLLDYWRLNLQGRKSAVRLAIGT